MSLCKEEGLQLRICILSDTVLNNLIPNVLDSLLDFHLSLLRRLRQRRAESPMMTTVSDIVLDEFSNGPFTHAALAAYTTFCQHKDRSSHNYEVLMSKNSRFRKYFESVEGDPRYKERSFKYSLLLVAQRPTKYTILLDQLSKQEGSEFREEAFKAFEAMKSFVKRLDNNLAIMELHRRWDHIQSNLDRSSSGRYLDEKFSYEDLTHICKEDQRMILCIGQVQMKNVKEDRFDSVLMLLFDDILAFLQQKGGKYYFYNQSNHDCVIAVQSLLIRQVPRQTSLMIVVVDRKKSDMLEVMFNTKTDLTHWLHAFTSGKERPIFDGHDRNNDHSYSQEVEMEKWERELCELFSARSDEKKKFVDFFNRRMQWMDEVECHLSKVPGRQPKDTATATRLNFLVKSTWPWILIQLQQRENEVEAKWQVIYEKTRNLCQSQAPAVVIEEGPLPSPSLPNGGSRLQHQRSFRYGSVVHDQARSLQQNSPLMQPSMSLSSMQNFFAKTESKEVKKKSKK
ncbi:hypothetical protein QR680_009693 [Steinernema hermaphroditum]|uniref:DH domain-containing protein n=1 Tax=Steinernema hermaphroditum TaxID=289476 RepID=A0AA39MAF3_9BILA|nr:hypothetical protein QR680_009693 [Steinernema hermaphroditum]